MFTSEQEGTGNNHTDNSAMEAKWIVTFKTLVKESLKRTLEPDYLAEQTTEFDDVFGATPWRWWQVLAGVAYNDLQSGHPGDEPDQTGHPQDYFQRYLYVEGDPDQGMTVYGKGLAAFSIFTFFAGFAIGLYKKHHELTLTSYYHLLGKIEKVYFESLSLNEMRDELNALLGELVEKQKINLSFSAYQIDEHNHVQIKLTNKISIHNSDQLESTKYIALDHARKSNGRVTPINDESDESDIESNSDNHRLLPKANLTQNVRRPHAQSNPFSKLIDRLVDAINSVRSLTILSMPLGSWAGKSWRLAYINSMTMWVAWFPALIILGWNKVFKPNAAFGVILPTVLYDLYALVWNFAAQLKTRINKTFTFASELEVRQLLQFYFSKKEHDGFLAHFQKHILSTKAQERRSIARESGEKEMDALSTRPKEDTEENNDSDHDQYSDGEIRAQNVEGSPTLTLWQQMKRTRKHLEKQMAQASKDTTQSDSDDVLDTTLGRRLIGSRAARIADVSIKTYRRGGINGLVITGFTLVLAGFFLLGLMAVLSWAGIFPPEVLTFIAKIVDFLFSAEAALYVGAPVAIINGLNEFAKARTAQRAFAGKVRAELSADYTGQKTQGFNKVEKFELMETLVKQKKSLLKASQKQIKKEKAAANQPLSAFEKLVLNYDTNRIDLYSIYRSHLFTEQRYGSTVSDWLRELGDRVYIGLGGAETSGYVIREYFLKGCIGAPSLIQLGRYIGGSAYAFGAASLAIAIPGLILKSIENQLCIAQQYYDYFVSTSLDSKIDYLNKRDKEMLLLLLGLGVIQVYQENNTQPLIKQANGHHVGNGFSTGEKVAKEIRAAQPVFAKDPDDNGFSSWDRHRPERAFTEAVPPRTSQTKGTLFDMKPAIALNQGSVKKKSLTFSERQNDSNFAAKTRCIVS